jgi:hypothetical protein
MQQLQLIGIEGLSVLLSDRAKLETKRELKMQQINQLRLKKEELYQALRDTEENISELFSDVYQTDTLLSLNKKACVKLISTGTLVDLLI